MSGAELLVLTRIGDQRFAWWAAGAAGDDGAASPAGGVEGVAAMAAVTPLAGAGRDVAGVLDVRGETCVVVDPRPALGLTPAEAHPDHHLLLVAGQRRFLVWVDRAEGIVAAHPAMFQALAVDGAPVVARLGGELVPILDTRRFDPSRVPAWQSAGGVGSGES